MHRALPTAPCTVNDIISDEGHACVRDEPRAHDLADQRQQIGRDGMHLVQQVRVQLPAKP